jgi:F0F1-type ATP synthase assembly protein I
MRRHTVGIIALVLLASALALWLWQTNGAYDALLGALVRVGLVMATFWLAWPDVNRLPAWSFAAVPIMLLVIAVRPKWFLILLPILIALAVLRPRTKARDRERGR